MKKDNYVVSCTAMLEKNFVNQPERFKEILLHNVLTSLMAERASQAGLQHLCAQNDLLPSHRLPDDGTLLHQYCRSPSKHPENSNYFRFLLAANLDPNARDMHQATALFYALENK